MKKFFILCLMAFMVCSCAVTKTITESYYGKITAFTPQGDTLRVWENALIEESTKEVSTMYGTTAYKNTSAFKSFGLNFIDKDSGKGVIIHSGIPYIIEYNSNITQNENKASNKRGGVDVEKLDILEKQHRNYRNQISENKKEMKNLDKNSEEYLIKKEQNNKLRGEMRKLEQEYTEITGMYMYQY